MDEKRSLELKKSQNCPAGLSLHEENFSNMKKFVNVIHPKNVSHGKKLSFLSSHKHFISTQNPLITLVNE